MESGVQIIPELESKAAFINVHGQVHSTQKRDGTIDEAHISGVLYSFTGSRLTSFHLYLSGLLRFSKSKYGQVQLPPITDQNDAIAGSAATTGTAHNKMSAAGPSSGPQSMQQSSSVAQAPKLSWRMNGTVPEYWSGERWIAAIYHQEHQGWMYMFNGNWYRLGY